MCSTTWHSQKFYALHKARVESLCACGASLLSWLGLHDDKCIKLPYGCLIRSNFTSKTLFWSSSPYAPNSDNAWNVNFNLKSSVGEDKVCCCGGAWLGVTARNGHSLSSSYNNGMHHHSSAIYSVAFFTVWMGQEKNTIFNINQHHNNSSKRSTEEFRFNNGNDNANNKNNNNHVRLVRSGE